MRRPTDLRYEDGRVASYSDIRAFVLRRDPTCRICEVAPTTEVDHIWPRCYGGDDTAANLQGVCSPCNKRKGNTVDPSTARCDQIEAAADAISRRITLLADDLGRFDAELIHRAFGWSGREDRWESTITLSSFAVRRKRTARRLYCDSVVLSRAYETAVDHITEDELPTTALDDLTAGPLLAAEPTRGD